MQVRKVLVVAVHPDDETLGCGGTLLKHKASGDEIYWMIITNISTSNGWKKELVEKRQKEIQQVSELYGFTKTLKLDFPTTKLDQVPFSDLVGAISNVFKMIEPEIIYLPNRTDVHTDHQIAFKATYSCTKHFRYPFIKRILMFEVLSETEFAAALPENQFIPNVFVDITDFNNKLFLILNIYKTELMNENLPRSTDTILSLLRYRGSRIGCKYAESFQLLFEMIE